MGERTLSQRRVGAKNARNYDRARDARLDDRAPLALLTLREEEVLQHTSLGHTNAQVAAALGITVHAVKFHLAAIFRKLGVNNRTEAAAVYFQSPNARHQ